MITIKPLSFLTRSPRAFFGTKDICIECEETLDIEIIGDYPKQMTEFTCGCTDKERDEYRDYQPAYTYHLQQMVLEEKPLEYLEQFI
jgi:hypothetical protein